MHSQGQQWDKKKGKNGSIRFNQHAYSYEQGEITGKKKKLSQERWDAHVRVKGDGRWEKKKKVWKFTLHDIHDIIIAASNWEPQAHSFSFYLLWCSVAAAMRCGGSSLSLTGLDSVWLWVSTISHLLQIRDPRLTVLEIWALTTIFGLKKKKGGPCHCCNDLTLEPTVRWNNLAKAP